MDRQGTGSERTRVLRSICAEPVEVFTTNGMQLLTGFYLFLSFVIPGLALSELVRRNNAWKQCAEIAENNSIARYLRLLQGKIVF